MTAREVTEKPTRHRVLIVDDEESMRLFLARILATGLKVEVTLAGTYQATRDRCIRLGASAYVVKPVERNTLISTVKAQIAGRGKPKARGK